MIFMHGLSHRVCGLFLSGLLLLTAGCSTTQFSGSGSFYTGEIASSAVRSAASDSAEFLAWKFPPAQTTLDFTFPAGEDDPFGVLLREKLRLHGFAVAENTGKGKRIRYLTDNSPGWIRVLLYVDQQIFAKTYSLTEGARDLKWTTATVSTGEK